MFDHVGLRVKDLEAAARLYAAMLAPLGHVPGARGEGYAGFGPKGKPTLWLHLDKKGGGAHVALRAESREAVDRFHAAGLKAGARDNGAPGLRTDYAPDYYAAFLLDREGNNVEAVCMR
ncbi:MAG TPA: VOC family protein [Burkholderiales bacterium]|nr:VOC family protein [Burkholderiales bacterium]